MVLAVLIFVLILSSFTIVASITMLIIDKKKDIKSLIALGANPNTIKKIFFKEGLMISYFGSLGGLLIGAFICFMQIKFHFLKIRKCSYRLLAGTSEIQRCLYAFSNTFYNWICFSISPRKILIRKLLHS